MLVDLEWKNPDPDKFTFSFDGNRFSVTFIYGEQKYDHLVAIRFHKGVYGAHGLDNTIKLFTDKDVINPWEIDHSVIQDVLNGKVKVDVLKHQIGRYGSADNLKQIFRHGRKFIRSELPFVLEIRMIEQPDDGGWRWHKNGQYIGKHRNRGEYLRDTPEIPYVLTFHFHQLKDKV